MLVARIDPQRATSILITLPCLVIFFVAQKQITNGITFTGGK